jgi:hypothetical protein
LSVGVGRRRKAVLCAEQVEGVVLIGCCVERRRKATEGREK